MGELEGKVVLITGASRGIGYAAALEAARRGAHVLAVARTIGGLEELDDAIQAAGSSATLVPLDLKGGPAIDRLGAALFERWGRLDGLVSNAGLLGVLTPLPHLSPEEFDSVFAVNVTATYRLLRACDLLLRQSSAGRVVAVTSGAALRCRPYWGAYSASKAALNAMVRTYAAEMQKTPVRINAFDPGATRTAMRAKAMPGEDSDTLPRPAEIASPLIDMISPSCTETGKVFDMRSAKLLDF